MHIRENSDKKEGKWGRCYLLMSQDMRGMRQDMSVLTHNVAQAMDGMRQMMTWTR